MAIANINIADFIKEGSNITFTTSDEGRIITIASSGGGGGTPGGADTHVQYNDGGSFGGEAAFTYNKTTNTLDVDKVTVDDEAYGVSWNGSLEVPTKNAVYDKIDTLVTALSTDIQFSFDGMGAVILTGSKAYLRVANSGTISGWSIVADGTSPTCTIDVWKIATGTAIPTVSDTITASAKPALSTGNAVKSTTLTGWTTSIAVDDIICVNIDACTNATKIQFTLYR